MKIHELFNEQELKIEPDPFGNNRRAKRKARLRAKADLVKQPPTVDPESGRISQQGSGTISRNINLDEPYNKPIPNDPWDKPAVKKNPATKPKPGVTIRRPKNLGSDW